ncbi:hypothetical protein GMSM_46000 [Geomonas sp. Red276]
MITDNHPHLERVALEARDALLPSRTLALDFLARSAGDKTAAVRLALHHVKSIFPGFSPRSQIGSPAEKLYNRLVVSIAHHAVTWSQ